MNNPLADRVRPKTVEEVAGQKHLLAPGKILRRIIESKKIPNLIFYGPSGVGKTTVANIIAAQSGKKLCYLNATVASTSDIKEIIASIGSLDTANGILLYLDEIQYFNKKQQQILLSYIESGDITLIAATTENPYFYVYNAILSRSTVFEFKPLTAEDIRELLERAVLTLEKEKGKPISVAPQTLKTLSVAAAGDVRRALNMLELCVLTSERADGIEIAEETAQEILAANTVRYDREGDEHYDIVSAYQKSMRGSDPDAALYYLARLLAAGDLVSACRRLLVCAAEDVGLAFPQILPIVKAAVDSARELGLPEARIPLADAVVLVATSPKSNAAYNGINAAMADVAAGKTGNIPRALQNKHFDGEDAEQRGQHYLYPHDYVNHYIKQQYLPDELKSTKYYIFGDNKTEQKYKEYWDKVKGKNE